jgi:hypothetical protein
VRLGSSRMAGRFISNCMTCCSLFHTQSAWWSYNPASLFKKGEQNKYLNMALRWRFHKILARLVTEFHNIFRCFLWGPRFETGKAPKRYS